MRELGLISEKKNIDKNEIELEYIKAEEERMNKE